jgi:hypothetical protein
MYRSTKLFVATSFLFALPLVCESGFSRSAAADVITLTASRDATIMFEDGTFANGGGENVFIGSTSNSYPRRTLLKFDLSTIPAGATITAASLRLTLTKTRAFTTMPITVSRLTADWGEGTSNPTNNEGFGAPALTGDTTWTHRVYPSTRWATDGGEFVATASATTVVPATTTGSHTWSGAGLIADVQAWKNGTQPNFGWIMMGSETASGTARRYASRTNGSASNRPQLTVTFTRPSPCGRADLNNDSILDGNDFIAFINAFAADQPAADVVPDGVVDGSDFIFFINAFGAGC